MAKTIDYGFLTPLKKANQISNVIYRDQDDAWPNKFNKEYDNLVTPLGDNPFINGEDLKEFNRKQLDLGKKQQTLARTMANLVSTDPGYKFNALTADESRSLANIKDILPGLKKLGKNATTKDLQPIEDHLNTIYPTKLGKKVIDSQEYTNLPRDKLIDKLLEKMGLKETFLQGGGTSSGFYDHIGNSMYIDPYVPDREPGTSNIEIFNHENQHWVQTQAEKKAKQNLNYIYPTENEIVDQHGFDYQNNNSDNNPKREKHAGLLNYLANLIESDHLTGIGTSYRRPPNAITNVKPTYGTSAYNTSNRLNKELGAEMLANSFKNLKKPVYPTIRNAQDLENYKNTIENQHRKTARGLYKNIRDQLALTGFDDVLANEPENIIHSAAKNKDRNQSTYKFQNQRKPRGTYTVDPDYDPANYTSHTYLTDMHSKIKNNVNQNPIFNNDNNLQKFLSNPWTLNDWNSLSTDQKDLVRLRDTMASDLMAKDSDRLRKNDYKTISNNLYNITESLRKPTITPTNKDLSSLFGLSLQAKPRPTQLTGFRDQLDAKEQKGEKRIHFDI